MPRYTYMLNSFRSGELGPKTHARTDTTQYKEGLDTLENFIPETSGGAFRRGGFYAEFSPAGHSENAQGQQIDIVYRLNSTSIYRIVLTSSGFNGSVNNINSATAAATLPTYDPGDVYFVSRASAEMTKVASDIYGYSYAQVDNVIVLVHSSGNMEPMIIAPALDSSGDLAFIVTPWLDDLDDATFTTALTTFTNLVPYDSWARYDDVIRTPFNDPNVSAITMNPSAATGSITVTASANYFTADMESDSGYLNGHRLLIDDGTGKTISCAITNVASATSATATVLTTTAGFATGATDYWYTSAWDIYNGYPKTVEVHDGRLVFGGTRTKNATVYASFPFYYGQLNRFLALDIQNSFTYDREPLNISGGVQYTIAAEGDQEEIVWMKSNRTLLIGTNNREYAVTLDPAAVSFIPQSNHGGSAVVAINAYNSTYFVAQNGRDIYEIRYSEENGAFISRRVTDVNDQILHSGSTNKRTKYVQMVYVESMKTIFAINTEYNMVAITLDPRVELLAFSKVLVAGTDHRYIFKGYDPYEEEEFLFSRAVNTAATNNSTKEWILKMMPTWDDTAPVRADVTKVSNEAVFVDYAAYGLNFPASTTITLSSDYEGLGVTVLGRTADDRVVIFENLTVNASNQVTTSEAVTYWIVGTPYTSKLKTLTMEVGPNQILNSQGDTVRIDRVTAKLYETWIGSYGSDENIYEIEGLDAQSAFSGEKRLDVPLGPDTENKVIMQSAKPLPFNILGLVMRGTNNP